MTDRTSPPAEHPNAAYETTDFSPGPVITFGVGILALVAVSFVIIIGVMKLLENLNPVGQSISPVERVSQVPAPPRLEVEEGGDLAESLSKADAVLNHYGWVDKSSGKVHIPIDRAIDLLAARGLPVRTAAPPSKGASK